MTETKRRGRPRTIRIEPDDLLRGIFREWQADIERLETELERIRQNATGRPPFRVRCEAADCDRQLEDLRKFGWTKYNLPAFLGRELSRSEAVVCRRVMRQMADAGLIALSPAGRATEARLTKAGLRRLAEIQKGR